ncbi:type II secretion system F family protein [Acidihalobacter ferrooxydans]|uniref:Type II secretion system protein F n=1 Tax=Acidihalobacter ferrooxydans TaxID=1765967 RepID=A0A1P8UIQ4_9GAMM|nr:type II secretion system F family protein [Acidihalobacter ferrooxydans]APZ43716.1 type II secretion system protein F [Acidihalobacter ferrooxydans]
MAAKAPSKQIFTWEGVDKKGIRIKGENESMSEALLKSELRRQGINPIRVRKKPKPLFGTGKKIAGKDIALFARQLSTMMNSGVPLVQALDIIGQGHEKPAMQTMVFDIKAQVEGGNNLADALAKHPDHFDELFVNLVRAGEQSGALEAILDKIATYKEKTEAIKAKIKKALMYPAAVVVVAIVVTTILLVFVVPQFQQLFQGFGASLPAFTLFVVHLSNLMQKWWYVVFIGIGLAGWLFVRAYKKSDKFHRFIDRYTLRIPIFGALISKSAIARFARTLATMFAAGVPLVEALESVAGATGNLTYADATMKMREDTSSGTQLRQSMRQFSNIFPNMVLQMVSIGEEAGSLDQMLDKVADFYEEEVDVMVDGLSSLLEPMIMVVLGVLVGGLVVAMYLPIFSMGNVVG